MSYFERLYRSHPDPWSFATRRYEQRKYAITVASLLEDRYEAAFEPGCSIGVLTESLAPRCADLLAMEPVAEAREQASHRVSRLPQVRVVAGAVPEDWPEGQFDLLVLSELCYYFDRHELGRLTRRATPTLRPGATVVAVHWCGETDYPLSGADAHAVLATTPGWQHAVHHRDEEFILDVWRHLP